MVPVPTQSICFQFKLEPPEVVPGPVDVIPVGTETSWVGSSWKADKVDRLHVEVGPANVVSAQTWTS